MEEDIITPPSGLGAKNSQSRSELPSVLIPHATNRASLAVVRSLGRRGVEVHVGGPTPHGLGCSSRFGRVFFRHPEPQEDPAGFVGAVARHSKLYGIGAVIPTADVATNILVESAGDLPAGVSLVAPSAEGLRLAHDKISLMRLAASLDVPVPEGFEANDLDPNDSRLRELGLPIILKPRVSRFLDAMGHWRGTSVRLAVSRTEIPALLQNAPELNSLGFLVQRRVPGEGRGVFLLARGGRVRCVFAHRRIREKPPWGGVSTLCETAQPEPELVEYACRLMEALRWTGVAMVEFKWDPETRRAWLMEINGRFWGSLHLALASGLDFPWLLYEQEVLSLESIPPTPRLGTRLWWIPGDMDHFLIRIKQGGIRSLPSLLGDLARTREGKTLDFDTFSLDDPAPFLYEAARFLTNRAGNRLV